MRTVDAARRALHGFSDEELTRELARRERQRLGKVLGYRVTRYGDEYNYGGYADFRIGSRHCETKEQCRVAAERYKEEHADNGGDIQPIYKSTKKPGRIH